VILARPAPPRRAALLSSLVLLAAVLRAVLLPAGDGVSTLVFGASLLGITWLDRQGRDPRLSAGAQIERVLMGVGVGLILLVPLVGNPLSGRPLASFWSWAFIAAVVATLEETAIRGVLYRRWEAESGPLTAILIGAGVFALIHLPRYGVGAMPLDFAVGLALGGLRALTGSVVPSAVAHTIADWGAWFWA